jgi:hypothetical protein
MSTANKLAKLFGCLATKIILLFNAPVTEPEYVFALEAKFWEFESPLGHQLTRLD